MLVSIGFLLILSLADCQISNYNDPGGGWLSSPNFPADYGNLADEGYNITVPNGYYVELTFYLFHTELDFDRLEIFDGPAPMPEMSMRNLTGDPYGVVVKSTGNSLYLHFTTDELNTRRGFYAEYIAVASKSRDSATTPSPGCLDSFYNPEYIGAISSVNWPNNYLNELTCHYFLLVDETKKVHLVIDKVQTEALLDYLIVYDGPTDQAPVVYNLTNHTGPFERTFSTNTVYIQFHSDETVVDQGFNAIFWPVDGADDVIHDSEVPSKIPASTRSKFSPLKKSLETVRAKMIR